MLLKKANYVLLINFLDFKHRPGGTNKVVSDQIEILTSAGYVPITICPYLTRFHASFDGQWLVFVGESIKQISTTEQICKWLNCSEYSLSAIIIHSCIGIDLDHVEAICTAAETDVLFYIHDYASVCDSPKLRDGCNCEFLRSGTCSKSCDFNPSSIELRRKYEQLFNSIDEKLTIAAPSQISLNIWKQAYQNLSDIDMVILPHLKVAKYVGSDIYDHDKLRLAYLGEDSEPKGFDLWTNIVNSDLSKQYDLYHLGSGSDYSNKVTNVDVDFRIEGKDAVSQLISNEIDCVLLWSKVPETFSFTCFEAMSAGCLILTNEFSGNIALKVLEDDGGYVYKDEMSIIEELTNSKKFHQDFLEWKKRNKERKIYSNSQDILNHLNKEIAIEGLERTLKGSRVKGWLYNIYLVIKNKFNALNR